MKKRLKQGCFPVSIAKFLTTSFFTEHLWWLVLEINRPENYRLFDNFYTVLEVFKQMENKKKMTSYVNRFNFI